MIQKLYRLKERHLLAEILMAKPASILVTLLKSLMINKLLTHLDQEKDLPPKSISKERALGKGHFFSQSELIIIIIIINNQLFSYQRLINRHLSTHIILICKDIKRPDRHSQVMP